MIWGLMLVLLMAAAQDVKGQSGASSGGSSSGSSSSGGGEGSSSSGESSGGSGEGGGEGGTGSGEGGEGGGGGTPTNPPTPMPPPPPRWENFGPFVPGQVGILSTSAALGETSFHAALGTFNWYNGEQWFGATTFAGIGTVVPFTGGALWSSSFVSATNQNGSPGSEGSPTLLQLMPTGHIILPNHPPHGPSGICVENCNYADDNDCDDGGNGAEFDLCIYGSDCLDCGPRPDTKFSGLHINCGN